MQWCLVGLAAAGALEAAAAGLAAVDLSRADQAAQTCLALPGNICLHKDAASHTLAPKHAPPGLAAWHTFDYSAPLDESGHGRALLPEQGQLQVGPGLFGAASGYFDGQTSMTLSDSPDLAQSFTLAMWVYLLDDSIGSWRTLVGKGSSVDEFTPSLLLWPNERRVELRVSTEDDAEASGVTSLGVVLRKRWTHVAATSTGSVLRLYINGILEAEQVLQAPVVGNSAPLRVGKDPWRAGSRMYLDDLRVYDTALTPAEVRALAPASLTGLVLPAGGLTPSHSVVGLGMRLGCLACARDAAIEACSPDRLCSLAEMYAHGFHLSRVQGWNRATDEVWYLNEAGQAGERLALCCAQ